MPDFYDSWTISRSRFVAELEGLSQEQLNWRLYPGCLTIGESAMHVAGVETKFGSAMMGMTELSPELEKIQSAAKDGIVNDQPFPFTAEEITPESVRHVLDLSQAIVEPALKDPTPARREVTFLSVLGPMITGEGAMARLGFHAGYHQGQVYLLRMHPDFPK